MKIKTNVKAGSIDKVGSEGGKTAPKVVIADAGQGT
jgi:hypothetical protein